MRGVAGTSLLVFLLFIRGAVADHSVVDASKRYEIEPITLDEKKIKEAESLPSEVKEINAYVDNFVNNFHRPNRFDIQELCPGRNARGLWESRYQFFQEAALRSLTDLTRRMELNIRQAERCEEPHAYPDNLPAGFDKARAIRYATSAKNRIHWAHKYFMDTMGKKIREYSEKEKNFGKPGKANRGDCQNMVAFYRTATYPFSEYDYEDLKPLPEFPPKFDHTIFHCLKPNP